VYVRTHVRTCTESKQFATGSVTSGLRRLCRDPSILKNGCKAIVGIDVVMLHMGIRNTTAMAPPVHRAPQLSAPELAWQCSYKRVKGRGHTAEKRIRRMHCTCVHCALGPVSSMGKPQVADWVGAKACGLWLLPMSEFFPERFWADTRGIARREARTHMHLL